MLRTILSINTKKIGAWISGGMMVAFCCFLGVQAVLGADEVANRRPGADEYLNDFCFDGRADLMSWGEVKTVYLAKTNEFFNKNVKSIMSSKGKKDQAPVIGYESFKSNEFAGICEDGDQVCQTIVLCRNNNSTFCTAINTTGFSPLHYSRFKDAELLKKEFPYLRNSYLCFHSTIEQKLGKVEASSGIVLLEKICSEKGLKYLSEQIESNKETLKTAVDPQNKAIKKQIAEMEFTQKTCASYELWQKEENPGRRINLRSEIDAWIYRNSYQGTDAAGKAINVSNLASKVGFDFDLMKSELEKTKVALDNTLELYDELQSAWMMHTKYLDVFNQLVRMRDGLRKIRASTDWFPNKFVNASTSRCL